MEAEIDDRAFEGTTEVDQVRRVASFQPQPVPKLLAPITGGEGGHAPIQLHSQPSLSWILGWLTNDRIQTRRFCNVLAAKSVIEDLMMPFDGWKTPVAQT